MKQAFRGMALSLALLMLFAGSAFAADNVTVEAGEKTAETVQNITQQTAAVATAGITSSIMARTNTVMGVGGGLYSPSGNAGGSASGKSSGNGDNGVGVWAMGNYYYLDKSGSGKYDGDLFMITAGVDKRFGRALVGVSFGGEWLDLDTKGGGSFEYGGFNVTPYLSYMITDSVLADFSVGYTWLDNDVDSKDALGRKLSDDYDSWRLFTAGGVTKFWNYNAWNFSARLGALYLHQSDDGFNLKGNTNVDGFRVNSSDYDLFQMQLGGRVGYTMGNITPFLGVTYYQDIAKSGKDDDMAGGDLDLGVNIKNGPFSMGLTGTYGVREDFQKVGGTLNFRYEF
ncbi:autotransporter outer membrane beta-barrel domain-containing protein [Desulfovibrio sp. OttesenSCG-928-I05]|nr:autotransporter outer membrane beta-barrel domain-containing protein [Desulfovibrio sp. OttesenSCG-928-I05]